MKIFIFMSLLCLSASVSSSFDLDIDDDGNTDALTDGLLILRYMFGLTDESLTASAVGSNASRNNAQEISSYLLANDAKLDIDGDNNVDALTDGLLILRNLFGLSDSALIIGVISDGALRTDASTIEDYIGTIKDSDGDNIVDAVDIYPLDPLRTKYISWGSAVWSETQWDKKSEDIIWDQTIWSN